MGPGNSLGVSFAFPSFTFPLRFRRVSVTFPSTFPSRFRRVSVAFPLCSRFRCASVCWASAFPTEITPKQTRPALWCCWARAAEQIRSQICFGTLAPTSSRNLRSRVRSRGATFSGVSSDMLPIAASLGVRCDAGPRVALTRMCFNVFAAASENPGVTLGSRWSECVSTFPSCFRQRFRQVSVKVSLTFPSTFPSRFRRAGVCPMETTRKLSQRFRGPLVKYNYI